MTEEEVNELERQEIEAEEQEERYKQRNILEDLEHRFEKVNLLTFLICLYMDFESFWSNIM